MKPTYAALASMGGAGRKATGPCASPRSLFCSFMSFRRHLIASLARLGQAFQVP